MHLHGWLFRLSWQCSMSQMIWSGGCPVSHVLQHGWPCLVLAKFMVMWSWEKKLWKEHLIQTYAMPLGKFLSITYNSAHVWNYNAYTNDRYGVHEEPVTPGLKYIFVIDRWSRPSSQYHSIKSLTGQWVTVYVGARYAVLTAVWRKGVSFVSQ
jgi:hypothetical protein